MGHEIQKNTIVTVILQEKKLPGKPIERRKWLELGVTIAVNSPFKNL